MIRKNRRAFGDEQLLFAIAILAVPILGVAFALALPLLKTIDVHLGGRAAAFSAAAMVAFPVLVMASLAWIGRPR